MNETLLKEYAANWQSLSYDGWSGDLRRSAWDSFSKTGFPTARRNNELWKYTNLSTLDKTYFGLAPTAELTLGTLKQSGLYLDDTYNVVLVNGRLAPELSQMPPPEVTVTDLDGDDSFVAVVGAVAKSASDPFVALNCAFMSGVVVRIKSGYKLAKPLQILSVVSTQTANAAVYPRIVVECQRGAQATVIESHLNLGASSTLYVPIAEYLLYSSANLQQYRVQIENKAGLHIGYVRVRQERDSVFESLSYACGAGIGRYDIHTLLNDSGANCNLFGLYLVGDGQHQSNEISTTHAKPHCTSNQFFKGILSGKSRAVFSGKVVVKEDAQKSDASQKDLNLLLSNDAEIDTKPSLEIYADDVTCGHGATAGHIDLGAVFYLTSRGVARRRAMEMLVRGFASEMVEKFRHTPLRDYLISNSESVLDRLLEEGSP